MKPDFDLMKGLPPLQPQDFEEKMEGLLDLSSTTPPPRIAVALSGGADSLTLTLLLKQWCAARGISIVALTLDHGLRPESRNEAETVQKWMKAQNIEHHILSWRSSVSGTGLQEKARIGRYDELSKWCHKQQISTLVVGHHLEDQIETFLYRLTKGSGLDGLACMSQKIPRNGLNIIRPLLYTSKQQLISTLKGYGHPWIEDPTNKNQAYTRNRLRTLLPSLKRKGFSSSFWVQHFKNLGQKRHLHDCKLTSFLKTSITLHPEGFFSCSPTLFKSLPLLDNNPFISPLKVLERLLRALSGAVYPPRSKTLRTLLETLRSPSFSGVSCAGCLIYEWKGVLVFQREPHALGTAQILCENIKSRIYLWDKTTTITLPPYSSIIVKALGEEPLKNLDFLKGLSHIPRRVKTILPSIWQNDTLMAVPHLNYYSSQEADLRGKICISNLPQKRILFDVFFIKH